MRKTITLYRPTGPEELALVRRSGFRRWPPRLPEQPIFYPVINEQYAIQCVGAAHHTEWSEPAEDLEVLNDHIVKQIEVIGEYR
jgi:hypothetical protein